MSALPLVSDESSLPLPEEGSGQKIKGIEHLHLSYFRNHHQHQWAITAPMVVLIGHNGVGKTNILEAISLLTPGRGLRSAKLSQISTLDKEKPWVLSCILGTDCGSIQIGSSLDLSTTFSSTGEMVSSERRFIRINQVSVRSQSALNEWVNVVWVIPAMARLFEDASRVRRKFIDRMVLIIDPTHNERVNRYEHFLRERSILLKTQFREGRADMDWLDTLEQRLSEDGVAITQSRSLLVHQLTTSQPDQHHSPFPRFFAQMVGDVESWCRTMPSLEAEQKLREHLKKSRPQDAQSGGAAYGPHRGDLQVDHMGKKLAADLCSTGEQKMLLLALTLAYVHLLGKVFSFDQNMLTLLLLDDVVAHLDDVHRQYLFQELRNRIQEGVPLQVWMTGTNGEDFAAIGDISQQIFL